MVLSNPKQASHAIPSCQEAIASRPFRRKELSWKLENCRVLVTGATGFIGQYLVAALQTLGVQLNVLSRSPEKARALWTNQNCAIKDGDLTDAASIFGLCKNIDTLFHLASHTPAIDERQVTRIMPYSLEVEPATQNLMEEAVAAGVQRLVFFSSVKAMGESARVLTDESYLPRPATPYGKAKLVAEQTVLQMGHRAGMHICVLRLPMVYGLGNQGSIERMIEAVSRHRFPPWPAIDNKRSAVHVRDAVRAALVAACHLNARNKVFILTDGEDYSTRWLYDQICLNIGRRLPRYRVPYGLLRIFAAFGTHVEKRYHLNLPLNQDVLEKLAGNARYSSQRIYRELAFRPNYTLRDELPFLIRAYT